MSSTGKTLIKWKEFRRGSPGQLGLEHSPCEEKLRDQDWFSLQKRQLWEYLTAAPPNTYEEVMKESVPGSSQHDRKTRPDGDKCNQERLRLDLRKTFFTKRITRQWNRFPREVVSNHILSYS